MRRILLFGLFFVFIFSISFAQTVQSDAPTWDFGKIRVSGGIVKHVFSLRNDSTEVLNIFATHASCGCTVSEIDRKAILPKEAANLEVKFSPKGYSGEVTQFAYVDTDSKNRPIHKFIIKANVIKD